jgi:uncharacterized protein
MLKRFTSLPAQIIHFGSYLRRKGYDITPEREAMALESLSFGIGEKQEFRLTLKSIFPTNKKTAEQFDGHFEQYFKEIKKGVDSKIKNQEQEAEKPKQKPQSEAAFKSLKNWLHGNRQEEELAAFGGDSKPEKKDFSSYTDGDIREAEFLIKQLVNRIKSKPSRRQIETKNGQLNLRNTLRKNLKNGSEINFLAFSKQKPKPSRIAIITDVSRSMEVYSRFFVQFMYAFDKVYPRIDTYVFSSELYKISDDFKDKNFKKSLQNLSEHVQIWSGGTQIGKSLNSFVSSKLNQRIDKKTIVMIVSDGLDTGEASLVSKAMKIIKNRAKNVIWINPLAGNPSYKPTAQAMQAALPFIDKFTSGHNLESLKKLILELHNN